MNQSDYVLTSDIDRHGHVTPRRIQLSRQKGWRLPPDAVFDYLNRLIEGNPTP